MLKILEAAYYAMRRHGEQTYPDECCGILLGRMDPEAHHVAAVEPCMNLRADYARSRYEIDPREVLRVQGEARRRGLEIVGFYHSHPDHPAHWSPTDLEEAHWIGYSYAITSVRRGTAAETNSFLLAGTTEDDKVFTPEAIFIESA